MTPDEIHMTEYAELKDEQRDRMRRRDALVRETWLAALVVVGAVSSLGNPAGLLVLPPITVALGWTYLRNDRMVTAIRRYIVVHLTPALSVPEDAQVLRWETAPRSRSRTVAKAVQACVDLTTFVLPALLAAVAYLVLTPGGLNPRTFAAPAPPLLAVALVEILAAGALAGAFIAQARSGR